MNASDKKTALLYIFFFLLIVYLLVNTGIVSDDFIFMNVLSRETPLSNLIPHREWITTPVESFFFFVWYPFFRLDDMAMLNILKTVYILLSFYMITKFFGIYLGPLSALMASFLFIFFPSHDSTVYWFLGQYLTLSMAFYLYAYYLAYNNRLPASFLFAAAGSFISYGSPALAISLSLIFFLRRRFIKGLVLLVPNIIYSAYYIFMSKIMSMGNIKIPASMDMYAMIRQFALQVLTFIDAVLGPSMWIKIYYSFHQLFIITAIMGLAAIVILFKLYDDRGNRPDKKVIAGLSVMAALSFVLFAITGYYPQLAFNLGNRTTIFGSLLIAYLFFAIPMPKTVRIIFFSILFFSILGISDHWKAWNIHQQEVIGRIAKNQELKRVKGYIYVSGNQYSRYGKLSHIEFFSEEGATDPIFNIILGKGIIAKPLNKRWKYADGYMVDVKYGEKIKAEGYINVYDSQGGRFFKLDAGRINEYIDSLPYDKRHWVQLCDIKCLKNLAVRLMPRLKYALEPS